MGCRHPATAHGRLLRLGVFGRESLGEVRGGARLELELALQEVIDGTWVVGGDGREADRSIWSNRRFSGENGILRGPVKTIEIRRVRFSSFHHHFVCLLYTSPSPRDRQKSRMPSSA